MSKLRKAVLRWLFRGKEEILFGALDIAVKSLDDHKELFEEYKRLSGTYLRILDAAGESEDITALRLKIMAILIEDNKRKFEEDSHESDCTGSSSKEK